MPKKKILFIVRSFLNHAPQPIRFQKIQSYLGKEFEIHVLMMHKGSSYSSMDYEICKIYKVPYGYVNRKITPDNLEINQTSHERIRPYYKIILSKLKVRKMILPDPLILDYRRIKKELYRLVKQNQYDAVLGSSFPFTIMMLSKAVKARFPGIKWIQDIGDPLYSPRNKYKIRALFSYFFENRYSQYVDKLIVTNKATKDYYIKRYKHYCERNVKIIPQGADINIGRGRGRGRGRGINKPIKLIYAGTFYDKLRNPFHTYQAITELQDKIQLDLYGNISSRHLPRRMNNNIKYHGAISNHQINRLYNESDIILFIDNAYGLQTPGKVFEIVSQYMPILCVYSDPNSASMEFFKKISHVFTCHNNAQDIISTTKQIILKLEENTIDLSFNPQKYSWEERAKDYYYEISEMLKKD